MTTLTVNVDEEIKAQAQEFAKKDWITLTFLLNQLLLLYNNWKVKFSVTVEEDFDESEILKRLKTPIDEYSNFEDIQLKRKSWKK